MKIKITESQYKRLLTEDTKSFLNGEISFPNIKNIIDPLVAKVFMATKSAIGENVNTSYLSSAKPLGNHDFKRVYNEIMEITGFDVSECILLTHNYCVYDSNGEIPEDGDWKSLIGKPLEFYGKMSHPKTIYFTSYLTGWNDGELFSYSTSYEDFLENIDKGIFDLERTSWDIDYDCSNVDWEPDWDYTYDTMGDENYTSDNIIINKGT